MDHRFLQEQVEASGDGRSPLENDLNKRVSQAGEAHSENSNQVSEFDNYQLKNELPETQYAPQTEANARLMESSPSDPKAYTAAEQAVHNNPSASNNYINARRYSSEAAAHTQAGDDAVNLDDAAQQIGGFKGNNYPTYDISSSQEVASVKTHWGGEGTLNDSALNAYKRDFDHMQGWGRDVNGLQQDGQNIITARDAGVPVPTELQNAGPEQASMYLRDNSVLRIPNDHIAPVQSALEQDIQRFPQNYHLSENPSQTEITHVLDRVQGIGLRSDELQTIIQRAG